MLAGYSSNIFQQSESLKPFDHLCTLSGWRHGCGLRCALGQAFSRSFSSPGYWEVFIPESELYGFKFEFKIIRFVLTSSGLLGGWFQVVGFVDLKTASLQKRWMDSPGPFSSWCCTRSSSSRPSPWGKASMRSNSSQEKDRWRLKCLFLALQIPKDEMWFFFFKTMWKNDPRIWKKMKKGSNINLLGRKPTSSKQVLSNIQSLCFRRKRLRTCAVVLTLVHHLGWCGGHHRLLHPLPGRDVELEQLELTKNPAASGFFQQF